jgi:hypothetical protein
MAKRGAILLGLIAAISIGTMFYLSGWQDSIGLSDSNEQIDANKLHSEILRKIVEVNTPISGITPKSAELELEQRAGEITAADTKPVAVTALPLGVLIMIAQSPTSIAGLQPKEAYYEIVNRTVGIHLGEESYISEEAMLEALQRNSEKNAIDKWAKNEDAEVVKEFLESEAKRDPSSVSNFVCAMLDRNEDRAKAFLDQYGRHPTN